MLLYFLSCDVEFLFCVEFFCFYFLMVSGFKKKLCEIFINFICYFEVFMGIIEI